MAKNKHGDFLRLASVRTEKVIQRIEKLQNCANRTNYEYSAEEVEAMFRAIEEALMRCREAYKATGKAKRQAFTFERAEVLPGQMSIEEPEDPELPSAEELRGEAFWADQGDE